MRRMSSASPNWPVLGGTGQEQGSNPSLSAAKPPQHALNKATKRFQHEYHTHITPEFQWAKLKGSVSDAEWEITEWGELSL